MSAEPRANLLELSRALAAKPATLFGGQLTSPAIEIELATPDRFLAVESDWRGLADRALETNAFLEPVFVAAASASRRQPVYILLAWTGRTGTSGKRLLGAWAFVVCRPSSGIPMAVLKAPVHEHAALGTPVVDAACAGLVIDRMLQAVVDAPHLPNVVEIDALHLSGDTGTILQKVFASRRMKVLHIDPRTRPRLDARAMPTPLSRSRSKALRQKHRRLAELGDVSYTREIRPADFEVALGGFLALEAAGWKGRRGARGRAILRNPTMAAFFRDALLPLSVRGLAAMTTLRVGGQPIAMQLTLTSGRTAFTWKTTYDEAFRAYGPGLLLLQEVTASLSASGAIQTVDSCCHRDNGYMAEFWGDRMEIADVVFDVRPGMSAAFSILGGSEYFYFGAKQGARAASKAIRALSPRRLQVEAAMRRVRDWLGRKGHATRSGNKNGRSDGN